MENNTIEQNIITFLFSLEKKEILLLKDVDNMQILYNHLLKKYSGENLLFYIKIISIYVSINSLISFDKDIDFINIDKLFTDIYDLNNNTFNKQSDMSKILVSKYLNHHYDTFNYYLLDICSYKNDKNLEFKNYMNLFHTILKKNMIMYKRTYRLLKDIFNKIFIHENNKLFINKEITEIKLNKIVDECREVICIFYIEYENLYNEFHKVYTIFKKDILFEVTKLRIENLKSQFTI